MDSGPPSPVPSENGGENNGGSNDSSNEALVVDCDRSGSNTPGKCFFLFHTLRTFSDVIIFPGQYFKMYIFRLYNNKSFMSNRVTVIRVSVLMIMSLYLFYDIVLKK